MKEKLRGIGRRFTDNSGQGTVEYILLIGLIVLFIVVILILFRDKIKEFINKVTGARKIFDNPFMNDITGG